jgi:hypothetical protein
MSAPSSAVLIATTLSDADADAMKARFLVLFNDLAKARADILSASSLADRKAAVETCAVILVSKFAADLCVLRLLTPLSRKSSA